MTAVSRTSQPAAPTHDAACTFLAVGPAAQTVAPLITARIPCQLTRADSILEAVLVSHHATGLILIDVRPEVEHLEPGLRSLRRMNPAARLVLLCEPFDEALCRRAQQWGADNYEILPVDAAGIQRLLPHLQPPASNAPASPNAPAMLPHPRPRRDFTQESEPLADLPAIPLLVQTEMLEEILAGTVVGTEGLAPGNRHDFALRATAMLARRLAIQGTLKFAPPEEAAEPEPQKARTFRRPVAVAGQVPFGTLVWQPLVPHPGAEEAGILAQAAHWLGTMLALAQRYEQLRVMAITDELSGAYNRRYFMTYMNALLERSKENRSRVTLLLFDIDDFKRYNDTFGHGSGDAIIRELIKLLRACTRPKDLVARVGGDEFAVVYWDNEPPRQPNSDHPKEILAATERFREAIKNHTWPETCKIKGSISISGGLASFPWDADTLESLMAKADEALLQAKSAGKNVIVLRSKMAPGTGTTPTEPRTMQI